MPNARSEINLKYCTLYKIMIFYIYHNQLPYRSRHHLPVCLPSCRLCLKQDNDHLSFFPHSEAVKLGINILDGVSNHKQRCTSWRRKKAKHHLGIWNLELIEWVKVCLSIQWLNDSVDDYSIIGLFHWLAKLRGLLVRLPWANKLTEL